MALFRSRQLLEYIGRNILRTSSCHWNVAMCYKRCYDNTTIYALSSGHGKSGVAVIRVSGSDAAQVLLRVANLKRPPTPRQATLTIFKDSKTGEALDKGILLWFPGPASFTGEDCCELHVHGGPAVVSSIFSSLSKLGFRLANPGEYTRRAFVNGKLDLTAVEGLADLVQAETESQRRQAFRQMSGELHQLYRCWKERVTRIVAYAEAFTDFNEDEQIEGRLLTTIRKEVEELIEDIEVHLGDNRRGERLRTGVQVVIVGSPNVGKSTLLNYICQKPLAIVSPVPGTTRDIVESCVNFAGFPIIISDTAGLRDSDDLIEREGVNRALEKAQVADIIILLMDPTSIYHGHAFHSLHDLIKGNISDLGFRDVLKNFPLSSIHHHISENVNLDNVPLIMAAINKMDQGNEPLPDYVTRQSNFKMNKISCLTGFGMEDFMNELKFNIAALCAPASHEPLCLTQERHRHHLRNCVSSLKSYVDEYDKDLGLALYSLRKCAEHLSSISGDITSEQILDVIFRDFCIGK